MCDKAKPSVQEKVQELPCAVPSGVHDGLFPLVGFGRAVQVIAEDENILTDVRIKRKFLILLTIFYTGKEKLNPI